jgi:transposase
MKTPKRAFSTEISANQQRGYQFSPEQKAAICAELWAGKTYRAVAEEYNTTASTAYGIFKRWQNTRSFDIAPRSGRPPKLTPAEVRYLVLLAKKDRKITYAALLDATGNRVTRKTLRLALRQVFKRKWLSKQRIPISKEIAKIRLSWARGWSSDIEELMEVWLSISCSYV